MLARGALVAGAVAAGTLAGCGRLDAAEAARKLDVALAEAVQNDPEVHGAVMFVDAPRLGLTLESAHGVADAATRAPMTATTAFYSASVGKLAVAATVAKLAADGRLSLDDPLARWVPRAQWAGLPVIGGDAALERVTLRMLLAHRSGLPDYFSGTARDGAPRVYDRLVAEPERRWTRTQLLDYARAHYSPAGAPGEKFTYADTNYDLLGLALEGVTGQPFAAVVRAEVLAPLGMRHTWYHALEPAPSDAPPLAEVYVGAVSLRGAPALTADQAGGGLITTARDLGALVRGLAGGRPVSFAALTRELTEDAMHDGIDVGLGVWRIRPRGVFFALAGLPDLVGHSGSTGVWAYYVEALDAVVTGATSQARWEERHVEFLLSDVLPVLARARAVR